MTKAEQKAVRATLATAAKDNRDQAGKELILARKALDKAKIEAGAEKVSEAFLRKFDAEKALKLVERIPNLVEPNLLFSDDDRMMILAQQISALRESLKVNVVNARAAHEQATADYDAAAKSPDYVATECAYRAAEQKELAAAREHIKWCSTPSSELFHDNQASRPVPQAAAAGSKSAVRTQVLGMYREAL